ncbi:MAG TPA: SxtJ family membrane protein [Candidatus Acidoferrales bacterium]|nr:SxtJ family membrane protein [Candidatus Acidoferrales bacterium]
MKLIFKIGKMIYKWWMVFARVLGVVNATILLTVVYIAVIGPMSIISKIFGKDLLTHRKPVESFWRTKESTPHTLEKARHQF